MENCLRFIVSWLFIPLMSSGVFAHQPGDPWTAHYMWRLYYNTTHSCPGAPNEPVYKCTGIILRATNPIKEPDGGWVPEHKSYPNDPSRYPSAGGVSFSYIRADATFGNLAFKYENGFTLWPQIGKYSGTGGTRLTVLCTFPIDAATDVRQDGGCGSRQGASTGTPCPSGDAYTWMNSFQRHVLDGRMDMTQWAYIHQCGYNLTPGGHISKNDFDNFLRIKQTADRSDHMSTFSTVNELRIQTWVSRYDLAASKSYSKNLPLQSFFFIKGSINGMNNARYDQEKYFKLTGRFIPIVQIKMPTRPHHSKATHTYPSDLEPNFDFHYKREYQSHNVVIPSFPDKDPLPCDKANFDMVCKDDDQAHLSVLH